MGPKGLHNALDCHGGLTDNGVDAVFAESLEPVFHQVHGLIGLGVSCLLVNDGDIGPQFRNFLLKALCAVNLTVLPKLVHSDTNRAILRQDLGQGLSLQAPKLRFVHADLSPDQCVASRNQVHAEQRDA